MTEPGRPPSRTITWCPPPLLVVVRATWILWMRSVQGMFWRADIRQMHEPGTFACPSLTSHFPGLHRPVTQRPALPVRILAHTISFIVVLPGCWTTLDEPERCAPIPALDDHREPSLGNLSTLLELSSLPAPRLTIDSNGFALTAFITLPIEGGCPTAR